MNASDPTSGNRLFLSCVTKEFEDCTGPFKGFRSRMARELQAADCEVKVQEYFRQTDEDTVEKLDLYIRRCKAVIHLIGSNPGAKAHPKAVDAYLKAVPDFLHEYPEVLAALGDFSDLTYTQWEAFMALHHGVSLFSYATPSARENQAKHLDRLHIGRKHPSIKPFAEPADLAWSLIGDLRYIIPTIPPPKQRIGSTHFIHHAAEYFLGREDELKLLDTAWTDGTNVLGLIAWGGVGKTSLLTEWLQTRFIEKDWKSDDGQPFLHAYFDWTFYDQGTESRTGSVGDFFEQALLFFGDSDPNLPAKGRRLAQLIRQQRSLIILDGLEPLQQPPDHPQAGQLLDPDLNELLRALAVENPGLCLITSREPLKDLGGLRRSRYRSHDLEDLPLEFAIQLLRQFDVKGSDPELVAGCEKFQCHALSITLLGRYLADAHGGDIRLIERMRDLEKADDLTRPERNRSVWKILENYENWLSTAHADANPKTLAVLRLTGLFDRTATADCLAVLRAGPVIPGLTDALCDMAEDDWNILLNRLERAHLIKRRRTSPLRLEVSDSTWDIDAHPLIREYFAKQLKQNQPEAFKAAHSRLFDHLCETTEPYQPSTLEALQPLYQAITHGCFSGRSEAARDVVFMDRIQRIQIIEGGIDQDAFFASKALGSLSSDIKAFEELLESCPVDEKIYFLRSQHALRLRSQGRISEALLRTNQATLPVVASLEPEAASRVLAVLSTLEVTAGFLPDALNHAQQSLDLADHSQMAFAMQVSRICAAHVLLQFGEHQNACRIFAEGDKQLKLANGEDLFVLDSFRGFMAAELGFSLIERQVWQGSIQTNEFPDAAQIWEDAARRAKATLAGSTKRGLRLDIALDKLTLARSVFFKALCAVHSPSPSKDFLDTLFDEAVTAMRAANEFWLLPSTLIATASYYGTLGENLEEAERLLEEVQQIAERGPMPLYLADVHLHRARLFGRVDRQKRESRLPKIDPKTDLMEARRLIEKHGYWRRKEELEDAEAAVANWF